ncbi:MAG: GGDEF domain-containing protein [Pseudomonadales bacterium]|nr:GGDEF domain-containing protein [Pseudomonadales bacterium]|tara:strand:+ start:3391 stop:5121 length:1731 start_codon:yes stop_codon:yes gene_type:complete
MSDTQPNTNGSPRYFESEEQTELLKRGLVRVSIAASGIDPLLDKRLNELRRALRSDAPAHLLGELLPDLERAVLTADQNRQQASSNTSKAVQQLIEQLQDCEPPREVSRALRALERQLGELAELPRKLPSLLEELQQLQRQTLQHSEEQGNSGLWSRLLRRKPRTEPEPEAELEPAPAPEQGPLIDDRAPALAIEAQAQEDVLTAPPDETEPPADSASNINGEEQHFSQLAAHIESILLRLLAELQVLETQQTARDRLREQVSKGLNWYELTAALDALCDLVLGAQQSRQADFERYLLQLNERLSQFQGNLEEAQSSYSGSLDAERELSGAIRGQVQVLNDSVRAADDLSSLKANVEARLNSLLENIDKARELREARDSEVAERLSTMVERIQAMEVEAQTFRHHLEEQRQQALIDSLTGLANRSGLQHRMSEEFERWQRYGGRLLLVVVDVDHFKSINDRFGHLAGDKVLRLIAQQVSRRLRKTDFIGRFGGEEFVILMPGVSPEQGIVALEELRSGIEGTPFHFKSEPVPVTISLGFTEFIRDDSLDSAFDRADKAMYQAKELGRNRVVRAATP